MGRRRAEVIGVAHLIRALGTWFVELMREMQRAQAVMHGDEEPGSSRTRTGFDPR